MLTLHQNKVDEIYSVHVIIFDCHFLVFFTSFLSLTKPIFIFQMIITSCALMAVDYYLFLFPLHKVWESSALT